MKYTTNTLVCCWGCIASANAWFASGEPAGFVFIALGAVALFASQERNQ